MQRDSTKDHALGIAYLQTVSEVCRLPGIAWVDETLWVSDESSEHPCLTDRLLLRRMEQECSADEACIFFENNLVLWGVLRLGRSSFALGPALLNPPEEDYGRKYAAAHHMLKPWSFRFVSLREMTSALSLLTLHFLQRAVPYDAVILAGHGAEHVAWQSESDLSHYQLAQSEYDRSHGSGRAYEESLINAVRNGDVEAVKQLLGGQTPGLGEIGEVAREERKQIEYLVVSLLTLLTRAAVEGGMRPEAAYDLGDIYLRRLAAASTHGGAFTTLSFRAIYEFAEGVRKAKNERKEISHVEACKAYVEANLLKNIQVGDVAPALGLSRSHLAHLFKRVEGITLQQYIQREKCRYAERQLKYTDYSIALISEYFGFSSPGYFSTCFQQWYGVTPSVYRRQNAK